LKPETLNTSSKYLTSIKQNVLMRLAEEDVSIALFGSTAKGVGRASSDVDVAVIPNVPWTGSKLALLRAELEESNIPYKVDIVDFSYVSPEFRTLALKGAIWWKQ